ncbi:MAG: hypothetical protein K2Q03_04865 [Sphingobacteriaceae bacterium]|nr:hypothetical protein [Sphingobacteriaceae bacterium]
MEGKFMLNENFTRVVLLYVMSFPFGIIATVYYLKLKKKLAAGDVVAAVLIEKKIFLLIYAAIAFSVLVVLGALFKILHVF